jgi:hypothetical protein
MRLYVAWSLNSLFEAFEKSEQKICYLTKYLYRKIMYNFLIFPVKSYDIEVSISLSLIQLTFIMLHFLKLHSCNKIKLTKQNSSTSFRFSSQYNCEN